MQARTIAVGLVQHGVSDSGEPCYVVTQRRVGDHLGGCWELPGGKVEADESPATALVRELREELGVEVQTPWPITFSWHAYPDRAVLLLLFGTRTLSGSPRPRPLAAQELRLVDRATLLAMPFPAANRPLLEALRSGVGPEGPPARS